MKIFSVEFPVAVREFMTGNQLGTVIPMKITVTMGDDATAEDAVDALAKKIEQTCNTVDIGDCT